MRTPSYSQGETPRVILFTGKTEGRAQGTKNSKAQRVHAEKHGNTEVAEEKTKTVEP